MICSAGACVPLPAQCPCPRGSYCDLAANHCRVGCLSDGDCQRGTYCDTAQRSCAPGCRVDDDCPTAQSCQAHACVDLCPSCDDGDPCTVDSCAHGACAHAAAGEGAACSDDMNPCTADVCHQGTCRHDPTNEGGSCPGDGTSCTTAVCKSGQCTHPPANEGAPCPDTPCSMGSTCKAGACTHPAVPNGTSCGMTDYDRCLNGACMTASALCVVSGGFDGQTAYWRVKGEPDLTFNMGICSCGNDSRTLTVDHLTGPMSWAVDKTRGCTACATEGQGSSSMVCW
jgi:hypothetical protein